MVQRSALILLHGRHGSPGDFGPFQMQLRQHVDLFPVRYLTPDAPAYPFEDSGARDKNAGALFTAGVREVAREVAEQAARGVPLERIAVIGLDAGANLVLGIAAATAAGAGGLEHEIGGYFALGGYLPEAMRLAVAEGAEGADSATTAGGSATPIFQYHGTQDGVVTLAQARETAAWFQDHGFTGYRLEEIEGGKHQVGPDVWAKVIAKLPALFGDNSAPA